MDQQTRDIYDEQSGQWVQRRSPGQRPRAAALAERSAGPSVDLGCGPGWYSDVLPSPVVALDFARSMLDLTRTNTPNALTVQADLEALPFRRSAFGCAWANHSYLHVPRAHLPLALGDLQRSMYVGGRVLLRVALGESEGRRLRADDDFPGRYFALWDPDVLQLVVIGAGFDVDRLEVEAHPNREMTIEVEAVRARTLPDFVAPDMRVLVCGLNPSLYSADAGVGYARPGNRFWPAAIRAGLVTVDRDPWHALRHHRVGFTDVVKRATVAAAELTVDEYRAGFERLDRLVEWLQPGVVAFVGLAGWRAAVDRKAVAGRQDRLIGGRPAYVLPSSSGLNTHATVASLAEHLQRAVLLA
jgi:TDG/mug DNA glycosylase family protein